VEAIRFGAKRRERRAARREADRLVAELGEGLLAEADQRLLVVDEQDRLAVAARDAFLGRRRRGDPALRWNVDGERRADALVALDRDAAAQVGDDAVDEREAEPGADADLLGREERIEDALEDVRRDPEPLSRTARRT
jgi:hypothetical protein